MTTLQRTHQWRGVIEEYRDLLAIPEGTPAITLREGGTPLVHSEWLSGLTGAEVWLKVEGDNPTGSFKDRGMTAAISVAVHDGAKAVVCASTGNTSASMAAYAAKAGLTPLVLVPEGKIAAGKMAQAILHGAKVIMVRGNFDSCLELAKGLAWEYPVALVNSVNPVRLEGQKTAAFEIVDFLGDAPDYHLLPVGNAGNISAYWLGYTQYFDLGMATRKPRMRGFQAEGAAPLVTGEPFPDPETRATAIRVGNPASWKLAEAAAHESDGRFRAVSDDQILAAQRELAASDGVFVEPASAAGIAGLLADLAQGDSYAGSTVVVTVTGHGLKDTATALEGFGPLVESVVDPDVTAAAEAAGLRVRVTVPATSANLGPGFDSLGLALDLRDELEGELAGSGLVVEVTGAGAGVVPLDEDHLVVRAMRRAFDALGGQPTGLRLTCRNSIPHARGLGSSSAAIVGGLVLARALVDGGPAALDDAALLELAVDMEGHPDNVAPALHGGFVISGRDDRGEMLRRRRAGGRPRQRRAVRASRAAVDRGRARAAAPAGPARRRGRGRREGGAARGGARQPPRPALAGHPRLPPPGLPAPGDAGLARPGGPAAGRRSRRGGLGSRADGAGPGRRRHRPRGVLPRGLGAPPARGRHPRRRGRVALGGLVHSWCAGSRRGTASEVLSTSSTSR